VKNFVVASALSVSLATVGVPALASGDSSRQDTAATTSTVGHLSPPRVSRPASPRRSDEHLDADNAHGDTGEDGEGRKRGAEEGDGSGRKMAGRGHRHGPPPWSHGRDVSMSNSERGSTWEKLTPAQRSATMVRLAHSHTVGMRRWKTCVTEGRQHCLRPSPPGIAKPG
jgi:hypothetical protein